MFKIEINIKEYFQYMENKFHMGEQIKRLPDKRKKPQIKLKQIMQMFFVMGALGIRSMRQLDILGRQAWAKPFTGSKRKQVVSDSSIERIIRWLSKRLIKEINYCCYSKAAKNLGIFLPSGKKVKAAVVDGSSFGKILASVFSVLGEDITWQLGVEPIEKRGKELPSSFKLIQELADRFKKNFVDYLIADGLYCCQNFFNLCSKVKTCGIVKTSEKDLNIIQDAEGIFNQTKFDDSVEHARGVDTERNCEYEIWSANNFQMEGVETPLRVLRVKEIPLKGKNANKPEIFWIITQDIILSALDLRELAHSRWHIENNGFKALNEQCLSKNLFTHDSFARTALLLIQCISFNILQLFRLFSIDKQLEKTKWVFLPSFAELRLLFWQSLERIFLSSA